MNARSAQVLAAALSFLLIILVGALIFFLLSRPQGPRPSPSPSPTTAAVGSASPLPSLSPSLLPSATPGASATEIPTISNVPFPTASPIPASPIPTPEITPEITPEVTPSPTPTIPATPNPTPTIPASPSPTPPITPSPTPSTPPIPTSPGRQIRLIDMGLDARNETGIERYLIFGVDGPSVIRAQVSDATGRARVCLWQGNDVVGRECRSMGNGVMEHAVFDAGSTSWTLTLISANSTTSPTVSLALDFNADAPSVALENFRFQGVPVDNYNGFTAAVEAAGTGELRISGNFDAGQQHAYRVVVEEAGVGVVKDETGGPAGNFVVTHAVEAVTDYRVTVSNPNAQAEAQPVFLRTTFSWP